MQNILLIVQQHQFSSQCDYTIDQHVHCLSTVPTAGIYIEVTGAAKCRWCEHVQQKRMTYRGGEVYLSARKYFVDAPADAADGDITVVPRGEHVYNFTCALPVNLPTSFEGTYGHIRYRAEVTLNVPLWPDKSFAEGFTVIRSVDLNALGPDVRVSIEVWRGHTVLVLTRSIGA